MNTSVPGTWGARPAVFLVSRCARPGVEGCISEARTHTWVWLRAQARAHGWNADLVGLNPAGCRDRWELTAVFKPLAWQVRKSGPEVIVGRPVPV